MPHATYRATQAALHDSTEKKTAKDTQALSSDSDSDSNSARTACAVLDLLLVSSPKFLLLFSSLLSSNAQVPRSFHFPSKEGHSNVQNENNEYKSVIFSGGKLSIWTVHFILMFMLCVVVLHKIN